MADLEALLYEVENVDIGKYPAALQRPRFAEITFGDLHGNALRLIYFLVMHHVLLVNETQYSNLARIYKEFGKESNYLEIHHADRKEKITKLLEEFDSILSQTKCDNSIRVRLIGDELADRGANDYLTLLILDKIHQAQVSFEILLSNHGMEFLAHADLASLDALQNLAIQGTWLSTDFQNSIVHLMFLLKSGLIKAEKLKILIENYKKHIKAIGYAIHENNQTITIFTHAPVGFYTFERLAEKFNLEFSDDTLQDLIKSFDSINTAWVHSLETRKFHSEYRDKSSGTARNFDAFNFASQKRAIMSLAWNRDITKACQFYTQKHDYQIRFIFGHMGVSSLDGGRVAMWQKEFPHLTNLDDSNLGKSEKNYEGKYLAYLAEDVAAHVSSLKRDK